MSLENSTHPLVFKTCNKPDVFLITLTIILSSNDKSRYNNSRVIRIKQINFVTKDSEVDSTHVYKESWIDPDYIIGELLFDSQCIL